MRTFKLTILTSEQVLFDDEAVYCGITTETGSIGFEAMHTPMVAVLKNNSDIHFKDASGNSKSITVRDGMLSFKSNTCSITASIRK